MVELVDMQVRFLIRPTTTIGFTNGGSTGLAAAVHLESGVEHTLCPKWPHF
jgi:hypothetical protein